MQRIVGILLAAGRGVRFGGDKLLAPVRDDPPRGGIAADDAVDAGRDAVPGRVLVPAREPAPDATTEVPLGVLAARHLVAALPDTIAIVRPGDSELAAKLTRTGLRVVVCDDAGRGLGASLAWGVAASGDAAGWVVALADMPWIAPATIGAIAAALASGADIAAPSFRGRRGHPVGFARRHYAALTALSDDTGARSIVSRHGASLALIDVADPGVVADVDRPADLRLSPNEEGGSGI